MPRPLGLAGDIVVTRRQQVVRPTTPPTIAHHPIQRHVPRPQPLTPKSLPQKQKSNSVHQSRIRRILNRIWEFIQYPIIALIALASAYSMSIGQWLVLGYGILMIILRKDSRLSFGIALFLLLTIPLFHFINQPGIAGNVMIYVFELLVVGTLQAVIELYKNPKKGNNSE